MDVFFLWEFGGLRKHFPYHRQVDGENGLQTKMGEFLRVKYFIPLSLNTDSGKLETFIYSCHIQ